MNTIIVYYKSFSYLDKRFQLRVNGHKKVVDLTLELSFLFCVTGHSLPMFKLILEIWNSIVNSHFLARTIAIGFTTFYDSCSIVLWLTSSCIESKRVISASMHLLTVTRNSNGLELNRSLKTKTIDWIHIFQSYIYNIDLLCTYNCNLTFNILWLEFRLIFCTRSLTDLDMSSIRVRRLLKSISACL